MKPTRMVSFLTLFVSISDTALKSQTVDLTTGLEAYWTFDEGRGQGAGDISPNSRSIGVFDDARLSDASIIWTEGRFGNAIDFDGTYFLGSKDFFGIGGTEPRTISAWIKTDWVATGGNAVVGWGPNIAQQRWHFKLEGPTGGIRTENQGGNNLAGIPINDGQWHHIVSVFPEGGQVIGDVDHYVDGVFDATKTGGVTNPVNTNIDPAIANPVTVGGSPFNDSLRFVIAALDEVRIYSRALSPDEIAALSRGESVVAGAPPIIESPVGLDGAPFVDVTGDLVFLVGAVGDATLNPGDISVVLNGSDAASQAVVSGSEKEVSIVLGGLEANRDYQLQILAADSNGLRSSRSFGFSTYSEDNRVIEAENYNFGGGQYFDDPILCNTLGGEAQCYFDKVSVPGVDALDGMGNTDDSTAFESVYRYSETSPEREEEFDTFVSRDIIRTKYRDAVGSAGPVSDYDINLLGAGDWANYTRTFPTDATYNLFARVQSQAAQSVRLDLVTGNPSQPNQTVELLGYFQIPVTRGYEFVPLTDVSGGSRLTVALSGVQTLRVTTLESNNNLAVNFLMFVPAEKQALLPLVSIAAPLAGSVLNEETAIQVRVHATDADGRIASVSLFAEKDGERRTIAEWTDAPYEVPWTPETPGSYVLTAEAVDNEGLVALSESVHVVVDSTPPTVQSIQGSASLNAIEVIFSEIVDVMSAQTAGNYTLTPSVGISQATVSGKRVVLLVDNLGDQVDYKLDVRNVGDANGNRISGVASGSFTAINVNLLYGLELYWTFDEGSGGTAFDLSGHDRNAVLFDVPAYAQSSINWVDGRFGGAIDFDGSYFLGAQDYYGIGGVEPRTLSMWIRTDWGVTTGSNAIMGWGPNVAQQRWHFKLETTNNGALRTENQGGNNFGAIPVNDGQWHHIAAVFPDGGFVIGDVNHYVDGVLDSAKNGGVGNNVNTVIDPAVAPLLTIGGAPLGGELRPIIGLLDDVRLYNRALSDGEISALAGGQGVLQGTTVSQTMVSASLNADGTVTISWTGTGVLQSSASITGPWDDLGSASSPYQAGGDSGMAFFRVRVR